MTLPRGPVVVWWRTIMVLAALTLLVAITVYRPRGSVSPPIQPAVVPRSESTTRPAMVPQTDDETAGPLDSLGDRLPDRAVARLGSSRLRYGDWVRELLFSPDGRRLAVWEFSGAVTICDASSGKTLRRRVMPKTWHEAWAWMPDGRLSAILEDESGSAVFPSGRRDLWYDLNAAKPGRSRLPIEGRSATSLSPAGNRIAFDDASQSAGPSVKFLHFRPEKTGGEFKPLTVASGPPSESFRVLRFSPDGRTLVAFSYPTDNAPGSAWTAIICDAETAKERRRLTVPNGVLGEQSLDVSNERIAVGASDGRVLLYDLKTGDPSSVTPRHPRRYTEGDPGNPDEFGVCLSRDGKTLATSRGDGAIRLWNVVDGKSRAEIASLNGDVKAMRFSPDGAVLAVGRRDGTVRLFKTSDGSDLCPQPGHQSAVRSVSVSMDGRIAATASHDQTIRVWDLENARERVLPCPGLLLTCAVTPDRKWILGVINVEEKPEAAALRVWNLTDEPEGNAARLDGIKAESLRFSPDGRTLFTVSEDVVTVWSWPECSQLRKFTIPRKPFGWAMTNLLASSADGKRLITSVRSVNRSGYSVMDSVGGSVDLFDTTTGNHLRELPGSGGSERAAFAGTSEVIVTGDRSVLGEQNESKLPHGAILVLDTETARVKRSVPTPGPASTEATSDYDHIFAVAASPDGRTVYLARPEGTIQAWEVASGGVRYELAGHHGAINALEVFSHGRRLASAGADASVLVWNVSIPTVKAPDRLEPSWDDLADPDAPTAYKAMAALAAAPDRAIRLLAAHLTKAPPEPTTDVPTTGRLREIRALEVLEFLGNTAARLDIDPRQR